MKKLGRKWAAACEIAKRHGIRNVSCGVCRGEGVGRHPAPEEDTGYAIIDPCPGCDGYGVAFQLSPAMVWSVDQVLERYPQS